MRAKCTGEERDFSRYRSVSNTVRDLTRKDHYIHLEEISLDLHKNQRAFWRWIKNIRGAKLSIPLLNYRNKVLANAVDKAKALNTYFCSIFTREDNSMLTKLRDELMESWSKESIDEMSFTENEVYEELCKIDINKACGPDEIPSRLLRKVRHGLWNPFPNFLQCLCKLENYQKIGEEPTSLHCLKRGIRTSPPIIVRYASPVLL